MKKIRNKSKRVMGILMVFLLVIILLPCINLTIAYFNGYPHTEITKIGHRGAAGLAPENTLIAVDSGLSNHVDYIEIDVRQTSDGQLIVMHDKSVDRTTDSSGDVINFRYAEIAGMDAS